MCVAIVISFFLTGSMEAFFHLSFSFQFQFYLCVIPGVEIRRFRGFRISIFVFARLLSLALIFHLYTEQFGVYKRDFIMCWISFAPLVRCLIPYICKVQNIEPVKKDGTRCTERTNERMNE